MSDTRHIPALLAATALALLTAGCETKPEPDWRPVRYGGEPPTTELYASDVVQDLKSAKKDVKDWFHRSRTVRGSDWDSPQGRALRSGAAH